MSGPVTLVTGASSGIGRELALVAAEESRAVILAARREGRLEELAGRIRELPGAPEAVVVPADLADEAGRKAFRGELSTLEARGLAIDHLVNDAGLGHDGPFHENDAGREATTVAVNAVALHELSRDLLPAMVERGYGRVLNVASTAAYQPLPYMATYAATKAFVLSLSEALWREYRGTGVAVTCLAPGRTSTEFFDDAGMEGIAFMKMPAASARRVARAGYRGMKEGKRVVIPGVQNKLTAWLAPRLPRRPVLAIAAALFAPRGPGGS